MVSATMEYDEVIYRKFYQIINDNYKYPLDMFLYKDNINRLFMDRRIHMSKPFSSTNYKITEISHIDNTVSQNQNIYNILKKILGKKEDGQDILIFKNGQKDINELRDFLIQKQLPKHVCILPYYSELKEYEKNMVSDISNPVVRESFKNPQYANPFDKTFPSNKKINYTYTQFIIISTNIAEASLTIKSLKYVIDTGEHKIKEYNLKTFQSSLKIKQIAKQNQLQRIGRVGRTKPGFAYYTYNHHELTLEPTYKIQIEDYKNLIFELYTDNNTQEITSLNDPNLITNPDRLLESLKNQYTITNNNLFNYPKINTSFMPPIHYPYNGKYHSPELIDYQNRFYITNPTKYILNENMELKNVIQPENVMFETFEHLKKMKMFDKQSNSDYVINDFGKTVLKVLNLYDNEHKIELTDLFCILHTLSMLQHVKLCEYLMHMIIIKIIFGSTSFILNIDAKIKNVKNEFEYKSKLILPKYYNLYSKYFSHINLIDVKKSDSNLMSIVKNIINGINIVIEDTDNYKDTIAEKIDFYKTFLTQYYYHYIIIQYMINNKISCGITYNFLKEFKSDFLCFYTGNNRNETIFQCLMIKYHHNNIIRKINKKDYVYYKIKNPSPKDEIYTLNSYSFVYDKNNVLYLNKNDDSEVSNLMTIDMWLLNKFKSG
jgi:hypothetical protein